MSDTPRTDKERRRIDIDEIEDYNACDVMTEFARQLERELTVAQTEINRLTTARALDVYRLLTRTEKAEAELAQLRAAIDAARSARKEGAK